MKGGTRKNAKVARVACPWLIRRFVDAEAEFLYVPADEVTTVARQQAATPFDVQGVELGHVGGRCSFESIGLQYNLTDPVLPVIGGIVAGRDILRGHAVA